MAREARLLTSQGVAELLGLSRDEVARLARRGDLPGRKAGGRWLFDDDELVDLGLAMIVRERLADPSERKSTPLEEFLASREG